MQESHIEEDISLETEELQEVTEVTDEEAADEEEQQSDFFQMFSEKWDADIFLYSGEIDRHGAERFLDVAEHAGRRTNASLVLTTLGGDPDAAYIIARYLQRVYERGIFRLYIFGDCKSAGTLLALGATEIIMSQRGEFGPLDIQLVKADEIFFRSSGLDVMEALDALGDYAFEIFEKQFLGILVKSTGAVSTRTAGEIATSVAVGLLAPITAQIDPLKLGEMQRAINIAVDYGDRLRANRNTVMRLVMDYSSHSFVIDFDEAQDIFGNVRLPDELELQLERHLQHLLKEQFEYECIRKPFPEGGITAYFGGKTAKGKGDEQESSEQEKHDIKDEQGN